VERQDPNYHAMTSAFSTAAASATTSNVMREHIEESITTPPSAPTFNIYEYFQPVFDQLNELNKLKDSLIDEGDDREKEEKKK
jgi:hypothetical protein